MEGDLVDNAAKEVATMMADQLRTSEPIIGDIAKEGKVKIIPAYYDLATGEVSLL